MKKNIIAIIVLLITALNFIIDIVVAVASQSEITILLLSLFVIQIIACWLAFRMVQGKRWSVIPLIVYYAITTFNVYTEGFSFYTKSGLNIQFSFGDVFGINLIQGVVLILLIIELSKKR